jgi:hypothetical protein
MKGIDPDLTCVELEETPTDLTAPRHPFLEMEEGANFFLKDKSGMRRIVLPEA